MTIINLSFIYEVLLNNWIVIAIFCLAWIFKGLMDVSARDGFSVKWFNKTENWENKYADRLIRNHSRGYKHWYYFGIHYPAYKEKFPFNTTILVPFFDGWHLFMFVFLKLICAAVLINKELHEAIVLAGYIEIGYAIFFNITYDFKYKK